MQTRDFSLDYLRLFELAPGAFLLLLPDLRIAAVTDAYLDLVMRRREDIVGRGIFEVFPDNPDDDSSHSPEVKNSFLKVFETGEPDVLPVQKYDVQRPAEEGGGFEERYWRLETFPVFNESGAVEYAYHRVENITGQVLLEKRNLEQKKLYDELKSSAEQTEIERRKTAAALADTRSRLDAALEAGEIGTWTWDPIKNHVIADANLAKFFSFPESERSSGPIEKYLAAVHPDDVPKVEKLFTTALESGDRYEAECRLVNPDNSIRWVVARGKVIRDGKGAGTQLLGVVIDITSRKKTEEELSESRSRLALALEAGRAGTFVWDIKSNINTWSPELEKMYGMPVGTFGGDFDSWSERVMPEDAEKVRQGVEKILAEGNEHYEYDFRVMMPNGELRWFYGRARFIYDDEKQPLQMIGINVDVTDAKAAQEELLERTMMATLTSDIGIALNRREDLPKLLKYCTDALVESMNAAFARIWTIDKTGTTLDLQASSGLFTDCDGNHSRIAVGQYKIGKIAKERQPNLTNDLASDPNCSDREWAKRENIAAFAGYPLIVEDKLVGVVSIFSKQILTDNVLQVLADVSNSIANAIERKQAEADLSESIERFQLVTRATNDAIWDWNLQTNEVWWNNAVQTMFGFMPDEVEPTSQWWYEHIHPDDRERVVEGIHAVIDHGGEHWSDEYRFRCADGGYKYVYDRGFAIHRDNAPVRMLGAMQDITDKKLIESEREQLLWNEKNARAEAETANRMKDEFLATLSHELRTPLSSILGWSRLLKGNQLPDAQTERAIETIERNAKAQAQLIEDVLDVSRIISGKMRLKVVPLDLEKAIDAAVDAVRPAAEAKEISLERAIDSDAMIAGDADRLQQIIWNLLSNAIKFTPRGGRVQIALERAAPHVEIVVTDTGIGIAPETLPYIFERFRQSDSSTTRNHGGLGLGLAIVRHLVELHGGTVHASSDGLNQGSVFTVTFPQIAARSDDEAAEDPESESGASSSSPRSSPSQPPPPHSSSEKEATFVCPPEIAGRRILIVDDEADTREMLIYIFESCGALVSGVGSVAEALALIGKDTFDVLVSDIGMPERDGYDLIENLRSLPPEKSGKMPAIALTAYARREDRARVLAAGFQRHVSKPVDPSELLAVVASFPGTAG